LFEAIQKEEDVFVVKENIAVVDICQSDAEGAKVGVAWFAVDPSLFRSKVEFFLDGGKNVIEYNCRKNRRNRAPLSKSFCG
jgi:hypothetical protein